MSGPSRNIVDRYVKPPLFFLCLTPFLHLVWLAWNDELGANPLEEITHQTGGWALRFLLITLAVSPLRHWLNMGWLLRLRRMLGLYAFFYATLHLLAYLWFDQFFDWQSIVEDVVQRPFITLGFAAYVLLIPLALTSSKAMIRRLKKNWQRLHYLIYLVSILAVCHFIWLVKADLRDPMIYAGILVLLLGYRIKRRFRRVHPEVAYKKSG